MNKINNIQELITEIIDAKNEDYFKKLVALNIKQAYLIGQKDLLEKLDKEYIR